MIWLAVVAALGWVVAGVGWGFWWGERTARRQAESWAATGHPYGVSTAEAVQTGGDDMEEAGRIEWEQTVGRMEEMIRRELEQEGRTNVSGERIREEAERMAAQAGLGRPT